MSITACSAVETVGPSGVFVTNLRLTLDNATAS